MKTPVADYMKALEKEFKNPNLAHWVFWNRISKNEIIHTPDGYIVDNPS